MWTRCSFHGMDWSRPGSIRHLRDHPVRRGRCFHGIAGHQTGLRTCERRLQHPRIQRGWQPSWAGNPDQELAALTRPEELTDWFNAVGIFSKVSNEANWMTVAGIPHATSITLAEGASAVLLIHMNLIAQATIDGKPAVENVGQDNTFLM